MRQQVAELILVRASGYLNDRQRRYPLWELSNAELQRCLCQGVGGVILLGGGAVELQQRTLMLRRWSNRRLLICADVEEGVGQRFEGASWLVPPLALGRLYQNHPKQALLLAERYGHCIGSQAHRCGLNWVLGPVCDINNNPANPVINVRAWGEDSASVSALVTAFQRGLSTTGVLSCAKHFPGHGDTTSDSHLGLPVLPHTRDRLKEVELLPFREAIAAGVDSVMTAHLLLPELDSDHPASLSKAILTDLLRVDLDFDGLIVTDALVMEAVAMRYGAAEAAVLAFEAGADLILMPADTDAAITGLCDAFRSGRFSQARLQASLQRRHRALERVMKPLQTMPPITSDAEQALEQELITTCLHITPNAGIDIARGINLVRVDSVSPCSPFYGIAPALRLPELQGFQSLVIHGQGVSPWQSQDDSPLALNRLGEGPVLLQLFLRGNPFRGQQDSREPWSAAVRQLQRLNRLAGLVIYGSPYIWDELKTALKPGIPAAYSPGQMPEAQQQVLIALFNNAKTTTAYANFTS
ncbi:glycosyl hydrolase family 3 [Synechococcus sp. M16CYN]